MPKIVFVASKILNGIVVRGSKGSVTLNVPRRRIPNVPDAPGEHAAGFAITEVPKAIWDEWIAANWNSDMVLNHLVFGHEDHNECVALCWKYARVRSGLEQTAQNQGI